MNSYRIESELSSFNEEILSELKLSINCVSFSIFFESIVDSISVPSIESMSVIYSNLEDSERFSLISSKIHILFKLLV